MPRAIEPNLAGWPAIEEAAKQLHTTVSTLYRWVSQGKLESAHRPRAGRKPAVVINPADIVRLTPAPPSVPAYLDRSGIPNTASAQSSSVAIRSSPADPFAALLTKLSRISAMYSPPIEKFLTLEEAVELTGLSERYPGSSTRLSGRRPSIH
jgi:excisionase family DNA binding protein